MAKQKKELSDAQKAQLYKPGQSGNPNGRPKGARSRSTIVREVLTMTNVLSDKVYKALKEQFPQIEKEMTVEEVMTIVMVNKAITKGGDVRAYEALMNSAYGRSLDVNIGQGLFEKEDRQSLEEKFTLDIPHVDVTNGVNQ